MNTSITEMPGMGDIERVLIGGDLGKLTPDQRVIYYQRVCQSVGLNPLTRPFDYIQLNGKLTLYAKKDATDQLRKLQGVSIEDVEIQETPERFVVKVKGRDKTGRADVEIGVVNKNDMRGDVANAQMKAVTKAKRRLTLSLCGLGWLDETEIETIPTAKPVIIDDTGNMVSHVPQISPSQALQELGYDEPAKPAHKTDDAKTDYSPIGNITPKSLVDNGLANTIPDAAQIINKLGVAGKPAAEYWPRVLLYRKWREAGHDTDAAAIAAIAGEQLPA